MAEVKAKAKAKPPTKAAVYQTAYADAKRDALKLFDDEVALRVNAVRAAELAARAARVAPKPVQRREMILLVMEEIGSPLVCSWPETMSADTAIFMKEMFSRTMDAWASKRSTVPTGGRPQD